jgi:hypothetical protein
MRIAWTDPRNLLLLALAALTALAWLPAAQPTGRSPTVAVDSMADEPPAAAWGVP